MVQRIHGAATAMQNLTENITYYKVYALSIGATTDPLTAGQVNIHQTGNIQDESQKNFEVLIQSIALRAMPVVMNAPVAVSNVANEGAAEMSGEGYVWKFAVERSDYFTNDGPNGTLGPVGFLVDEIDGIVLPNATVLSTSGADQNIEFQVSEF
jgi:hypothetical protein